MRQRADSVVVAQGLAENRSQARALIMAGRVFWLEQRVEKAGEMLPETAVLTARGADRYVSRGGDKLEGALRELDLNVSGLVVLDVGASTGGFTDCLLQAGAARIYAVDVGHGQLAERLQRDPRVIARDRTNARHLRPGDFPEPLALVAIDASFISLAKLVPAISRLLAPGALLLALVKPQFEAGREAASRGRGVIRDPQLRETAIAGARAAILAEGFAVVGEADSRIAGPKGNVERFILARRLPPDVEAAPAR